jgi:hypothetical protein
MASGSDFENKKSSHQAHYDSANCADQHGLSPLENGGSRNKESRRGQIPKLWDSISSAYSLTGLPAVGRSTLYLVFRGGLDILRGADLLKAPLATYDIQYSRSIYMWINSMQEDSWNNCKIIPYYFMCSLGWPERPLILLKIVHRNRKLFANLSFGVLLIELVLSGVGIAKYSVVLHM